MPDATGCPHGGGRLVWAWPWGSVISSVLSGRSLACQLGPWRRWWRRVQTRVTFRNPLRLAQGQRDDAEGSWATIDGVDNHLTVVGLALGGVVGLVGGEVTGLD